MCRTGSLLAAMRALADRFDPVVERLLKLYRGDQVIHADETGCRTDGQNGYAWLFATPELSIFRFRQTRSAQTRSAAVVREVFGPRRLPGTLVVDRYAAYNAYPGRIQYCYAHLLRDLKDLSKEFPDNAEIRTFVDTLAPLLAAAMHARALCGSDRLFLQQAALIERQIQDCIDLPAQHPAVQNFQNIMSVLHSLQKQTPDVPARLKAALDRLAEDPKTDLFRLLFPAKGP